MMDDMMKRCFGGNGKPDFGKEQEDHTLLIFSNFVLMTVVVTLVGLFLTLYSNSFTNVLQEGWFLILRQVSAVQNFIGMERDSRF